MIRAFSSTTEGLVSFFRSSQANQKSRLSSLYSERRNSRKVSRPSKERSIISKLRAHDRTSSRLGCLRSNMHVTDRGQLTQDRGDCSWLVLLFFCRFNTVHLGASLPFAPLYPIFVPGLKKQFCLLMHLHRQLFLTNRLTYIKILSSPYNSYQNTPTLCYSPGPALCWSGWSLTKSLLGLKWHQFQQ